ncbi:uncharacterized protein LOC132788804 [Drosophila nasuta]|uniref:uncharacterized protein LOC132788804 n=1 Tax=Drosophila nasuta TaxID=42062 RepID=UPI00295E97F2|nr:uncharacterized protein LOC132788804 [Drosophila nasuta]
MSMPRHNVTEIILMVIVVILSQRLSCSASNSNKYGKNLIPWTSHGGRLLQPLSSNDPSALFDELDRQRPAKNFPKWHHLMKIDEPNLKENENNQIDIQPAVEEEQAQHLLLPSSLSATSNDARQEEQRQRNLERLQNEAADREFEQIMRKLKFKLQRDRETESVLKSVNKKDQQNKNFLNFCKKSKGNKLKETPTTTTTTTPTTESSSTFFSTSLTLPAPPTLCPAILKPNKCKNRQDEAELKPEAVDRLMKTITAFKRHALLILKNLNLLEIEILNRWPGGCAPANEAEDETQITTTKISDASRFTTTTNRPERLEKPSTPRPKIYKDGFHFGLRATGKQKTNMAAAMREQRKLEQKVREEYQMQLKQAEWKRHQLQRLKCNRKRARFEAAPPAAVRLELMTTPRSNIVDNTKVILKHPYVKQSSAAINQLAHKVKMFADRNQIDLTRQPLLSWKIMKNIKKRKQYLGDRQKVHCSSMRTE